MIISIDKEDANNDCDDMRNFNHYYYLLFFIVAIN